MIKIQNLGLITKYAPNFILPFGILLTLLISKLNYAFVKNNDLEIMYGILTLFAVLQIVVINRRKKQSAMMVPRS
jgi:hypothetical protein